MGRQLAYWLVKTEPGSWSWDDQVRERTTHWDGVRNYQAANNMKAMKRGDHVFFYHSVDEKRIVGIVEVIGEYQPDPSDAKGRFGMVEVAMVKPVERPVTLHEIKAEPKLAELALVRHSRLSVMPVGEAEWRLICRMGETAVWGRILCCLEDIEDGEGKGFVLGEGAAARDIFVVREGARIFGYVNSCPHQGTPLDWTPDRFISDHSGLILCATHGAQFTIADGTCVSGPCIGARLQSVPVATDAHGRVVIARVPES